MDSRFHLKVKFSIYGEDYEWDCSLNWSADYGRIDEQIIQWFEDCHDRARAKFDARMHELDRERRERALRESELLELHRLKEKYETDNKRK